MVGLSFVGYWKLTLTIFRITLLRLFTPSIGPGSGKTNFIVSLLSSKYAFLWIFLHKLGQGSALFAFESLQL